MEKKTKNWGRQRNDWSALLFCSPPFFLLLLSCVENIELVLCSCHEPHEFLYITKGSSPYIMHNHEHHLIRSFQNMFFDRTTPSKLFSFLLLSFFSKPMKKKKFPHRRYMIKRLEDFLNVLTDYRYLRFFSTGACK